MHRFCHIADCHIGAWRDPKMRQANSLAFERAVQMCIEFKPSFVIIAGDLFNTSLPALDSLKEATKCLKKMERAGIKVYAIAGSHDYSPTGKSILDVMEQAGLLTNITRGEVIDGKLKLKPFIDEKTGAIITGMLGKRGMLDRKYYEAMDNSELESMKDYKIFVFHTQLTELKTDEFEKIDSTPVSMLPKGFDYYAGGHVHIVKSEKIDGYGIFSYPGPTFPNSFSELEKLGCGGVNFIEFENAEENDEETYKGTDKDKTENTVEAGEKHRTKVSWHPVRVFNSHSITLNITGLTPEQIKQSLVKKIQELELIRTILTIRIHGRLKSGTIADIDLNSVMAEAYSRGAYYAMRNTSGIEGIEMEEIKVQSTVAEIEQKLIKEHFAKSESFGVKADEHLIKSILASLNIEKEEGETNPAFEDRVVRMAYELLGVDNKK